jgi:hypothetical protein
LPGGARESAIVRAGLTAQIDEACFGARTQLRYIDARRHRKQDMPRSHTRAHGIAARMRRVIATARHVGRFLCRQRTVEQRFDRRGSFHADSTVHRRGIVIAQQAGFDRGLAQELGAGALSEHLRAQRFAGQMKRDTVDCGHLAVLWDRHLLPLRFGVASACVRAAG